MYECLDLFSPPTAAWFRHAFAAPTDAQQEAWPHIKAKENVLVVAPTGSGKTLAAFLSAIDGLIGEQLSNHDDSVAESKKTGAIGEQSGRFAGTDDSHKPAAKSKAVKSGTSGKSGVKVLYISPLKALGADVERNLRVPLEGIAAQCVAEGLEPPDIDVAIRSGTPQPRNVVV